MAATTRGTVPTGVVLNTDPGTQFTSEKLATYMRADQGAVSMGWVGVCWDNAMAESFWATLKTEYCYRRTFTTRDQVELRPETWTRLMVAVMRLVGGPDLGILPGSGP